MRIRHHWIKFWSIFFKSEKNIVKNKYDILNLLFNSEYQQITTKESVDLFREVQKEFHQELAKRKIDAEETINAINEYFKP